MYEPILTEDSSRSTETSKLPPTDEGSSEKKRRERIKALQFFLRIIVNGRHLKQADGLAPLEVPLKPLSKDFDFSMQVAAFSSFRNRAWLESVCCQACDVIQLVSSSKLPEITIQVLEGSRLSRTEISTILVPHGADSLDDRVGAARLSPLAQCLDP